MKTSFDVIVIGAGHAGIEASLASARLGCNTLCVTTRLDRIGYMSCNPAIGGLAKGHMVRELDVLGGEMARATDATCIQFKRLNSNRGPAVRGSRAQCDKDKYSSYMIDVMSRQANLSLLEGEARELILNGKTCEGVILADGTEILSRSTVITTGTFMNGIMHVGHEQMPGGRIGDKATVGLSDQLRGMGFVVRRLKTGTPPRLKAESINWSKTEPQTGDRVFYPFSFRSNKQLSLPQVECFLTYTNEKTHEILRTNLHRSPIYAGIIEGIGPRYCPSIEDKICRFAERARHQTFLEPEGLDTNSIYLQGISTSMPEDIQDKFLRTIPGLENVEVLRYGYAIEYDFIEPTQLTHSLETRAVQGLFLAGQVNGTSGYEEAAGQGLMAGINSARKVQGLEAVILKRHEAYIGVLIDDLVTKGTLEPYRMFTSRAEHRLVLREDNTIERLLLRSQEIGLLQSDEADIAREHMAQIHALRQTLSENTLYPTEETQSKLIEIGTTVLQKPCTLKDMLRRSEIDLFKIKALKPDLLFSQEVGEAVEIWAKYQGYISRQQLLIDQTEKLESMNIPISIDYKIIKGLSVEEREKLERIRPSTLGQAYRISGVNPSAIHAILFHIKSTLRSKTIR